MAALRVAAAVLALTASSVSADGSAEEPFALLMPSYPPATGYNANPNATAVVPVPGWNMAKPYPGYWQGGEDQWNSTGGRGWTMRINLTERVSTDRPYKSGVAMRQTIELRPPTTPGDGAVWDPQTGNWIVNSNITDTWLLRFAMFSKLGLPAGKGNNEDGSCTGILSDECIEGIRGTYRSGRSSIDGNEEWTSGMSVTGCPMDGYSVGGALPLDANFTRDATLVWDEPISVARDRYEGLAGYDFWGTRPVAYAIMWGHSNTTAKGEALAVDHVTVGCIRADTAVGGSRLPSTNAKVGSAGKSRTWSVASAAVALLALVL